MDPIAALLLWRTQSGYHFLGVVGFALVMFKAIKIRPTEGKFLPIRVFSLVLASSAFAAGLGELYFNVWFVGWFGLQEKFFESVFTFLWVGALIFAFLCRFQDYIGRRGWVELIGIQTVLVMIPWLIFGFPITSNLYTFPIEPNSLNLTANFFEIWFYVVWTVNLARIMRKPLTNSYKTL